MTILEHIFPYSASDSGFLLWEYQQLDGNAEQWQCFILMINLNFWMYIQVSSKSFHHIHVSDGPTNYILATRQCSWLNAELIECGVTAKLTDFNRSLPFRSWTIWTTLVWPGPMSSNGNACKIIKTFNSVLIYDLLHLRRSWPTFPF